MVLYLLYNTLYIFVTLINKNLLERKLLYLHIILLKDFKRAMLIVIAVEKFIDLGKIKSLSFFFIHTENVLKKNHVDSLIKF